MNFRPESHAASTRPAYILGAETMPVANDGDIVRGLGFVTMYAAWLEEDVDDILRFTSPVEPFGENKQRWPISRKLKHAAKVVRKLKSSELDGLPEALEGAVDLFERRNAFVHGRIYAGHERVDYVNGGRPNKLLGSDPRNNQRNKLFQRTIALSDPFLKGLEHEFPP